MAQNIQDDDVSDSQIYGMYHRFVDGAKKALAAGDTETAEELHQHALDQLVRINAYLKHRSGQDNPAFGMSGAEQLAAGAGQGVVDTGRHIGNLVGSVSDEELQDAAARDAPLLRTGAGFLGSGLGQGAAFALPGEGAIGLASRLPKIGRAVAASPVLRSAVVGGTQGAVMGDPGHKLEAAGLGAAAGAALPAAVKTGQKAIFGLDRTPEAQTLIDAGVYPTIGQLKPGGVMSHVEQAPIVRQVMDMLHVKDRVRNEWLHAATEAAAAPGATITPGTPGEMLDQAYRSFAPLYDQAKGVVAGPYIKTPNGNVPLRASLMQGIDQADAPQAAKDQALKWIDQFYRKQMVKAGQSGRPFMTDDLHELRSDVRSQMRKYGASKDPYSQGLSDAYDKADDVLTQALESHLPPDRVAAVRAADAQYGTFKGLEKAVWSAARNARADVGPTPRELTSAVLGSQPAGDTSLVRGTRNNALADLAQAAGTTFRENAGSRTGHSLGFAGLLAGLAEGTGLALGHPYVALPTALGTMGIAGTRASRQFAAGAYPWQRTAAQKITGMTAPAIRTPFAPRISNAPTIKELRDRMMSLSAPAAATYALRSESRPEDLAEDDQ